MTKYYIALGTLFKIEDDVVFQLGEGWEMSIPTGDGWSKRSPGWKKVLFNAPFLKEISPEEAHKIHKDNT